MRRCALDTSAFRIAQVVCLCKGCHPRSVPEATAPVDFSFVVFSQWMAWTQSMIVGAVVFSTVFCWMWELA